MQCTSCGAQTPRDEFQHQLAALNPEVAAAVAKRAPRLQPYWTSTSNFPTKRADALAPSEDGGGPMERVPIRRPDGDVELVDADVGFHVPACHVCGGVLKPAVVFFGDNVPKPVAARWATT